MTLTAFPFTKHLLNSLSKRPKQPSFPWQRVFIIHQTKTMKKKVIIKVPMNGEKPQNKAMKVVARVLGLIVICRLLRKGSDSHSIVNKNKSRAMTIAVGLPGVESVSLKGQENNELEVIGDGIDAVELTNLLRKKIGFAEIMGVSAVDEKKAETKAETKTETKTENEPKLNYYYSYGGLPHYQVFEYPVNQPSCFFF